MNFARDFHVMRYVAADDFGLPETAFLICRFWLIDAIWETGRREEARDMFVDALRLRNRYGLLVRRRASRHRETVGEFSADLFNVWSDFNRDQIVAQLGRPLLARLIIVSNRVGVPDGGARAGGLEVAIRPALRRRGGVWFGWSGRIAEGDPGPAKVVERDNVSYVDRRPAQGRLSGILQRLRQPGVVADPALPARPRGIHRAAICRAISASTNTSPAIWTRCSSPTTSIWVHDYHLIPLAKALRERGHRNKIGFFLHVPCPPPEILTALPNHERLIPALGELRSGRLPDRNRCRRISPAISPTKSG